MTFIKKIYLRSFLTLVLSYLFVLSGKVNASELENLNPQRLGFIRELVVTGQSTLFGLCPHCTSLNRKMQGFTLHQPHTCIAGCGQQFLWSDCTSLKEHLAEHDAQWYEQLQASQPDPNIHLQKISKDEDHIQLKRLYAQGERNFRGAVFKHIDLKGFSLADTDLRGASFSDLNITDMDFTNADLRGAKFNRVVLRNTNFKKSDFRGAKLQTVNFGEVNFTKANFENTHLGPQNWRRSNLKAVNFQGASFEGSLLSRTNVLDLYASGYRDFSKIQLEGINLSGTTLVGADFTESRLHRASFQAADLQQVCFKKADLRLTDFRKADLRKANFEQINIGPTTIVTRTSVVNGHVITSRAMPFLRHARVNEARLDREALHALYRAHVYYFKNVDLSGVDLSGLSLFGIQLWGANTRGTNLQGTRGIMHIKLRQALIRTFERR
ncbi:MAG: pentapeptide repeat-containing protein [Zetaproteobacteria bacterium]|nr:pentapeptide repeat-containing protein [Zetaproteobacteria bacterium]